ncbi:CPP1-like family protein [Leptolyngbya sp. FACHB-17]|uniref:CPP1-like family protein n=1 Tax=unclassified Leptolyngbya TaxID=2650499 RepID=UPI0016812D07|nr:CPP1-like family protein [Leptolyngbya sp. FACHB-17]MBD2081403.1 CPP1-like family protein [Leptolyngbya sp. FACHB-17]
MSAQSPYEKLGVSEGATFEEIQTARARLVEELAGDQRKIAEVEAAYDSVLMERLRLRQEGKIKVPDRIRFPEKLVQATPTETPAPASKSNQWLMSLIDQPSTQDIAFPGVAMVGLGTLVYLYPTDQVLQVSMALATGTALYFLFRKERKLGRAVLLGVAGLLVGFAIGGVAYTLLQPSVPMLPPNEIFISLVTFLVLWVVSSFTK